MTFPIRRVHYELIPAGLFLFILPFTHTVALRLLCLMFAGLIALYRASRNPRPFPPGKIALAFWASVCLLSVTWSVRPAYSIAEFRNEVGYTILAYFVFFYLTENEANERLLRRAIAASFIVISVYAIVNYIWHNDWSTTADWLGDRNAYSTYIVLIVPFLLLTAARTRRGSRRYWLLWITAPLVCISGYLTLNRMMWLALIAEAAIFCSLHLRKQPLSRRTGVFVLSAFAALCSLAVIVFITASYVKSGAHAPSVAGLENSVTHDPRPQIWSYAVQRIAQRPWTGYGFGRGILRHEFIEHFGNLYYWHAHNMLLNYALEAGPWGVIALLLLFATFLREYWKLYKNPNPEIGLYGQFGLALLVGAAVKSLTDDIIIRENSLLFWSLIGMSLGYAGHKLAGITESPPSPSAPDGER